MGDLRELARLSYYICDLRALTFKFQLTLCLLEAVVDSEPAINNDKH